MADGHTAMVKGVAAHTDLSVTGWNIQALKAAVYTGISIDGIDEALDKAIKYTKECQDKVGKFAYQRGKTWKGKSNRNRRSLPPDLEKCKV